jgi:hypothetical protein
LLQNDPDKSAHFRPFIRPDLTEKEREADYNLRMELKKARETDPGAKIGGGKIIPGK